MPNKVDNRVDNIDDLINFHKDFAQAYIRSTRGFRPQAVIHFEDGRLWPILIGNHRNDIKNAIKYIEKMKDKEDWIMIMFESYHVQKVGLSHQDMKNIMKTHEPGDLEQRYLAGDKDVKWTFSIQAYLKENKNWIKKWVLYEIKTVSFDFVKVFETTDFDGYLMLDL